ncbi:MAG TPA: HAD family hydrolase [Rhodocyclaceae bacterium]|nr:HAD family hydrolase [Rhodocyclaceae bacterium]
MKREVAKVKRRQMGKPYSLELDRFSRTVEWSRLQNVDRLRRYLARWIGEPVCIVGSGGSYSAAVIGSLFREAAHHSFTNAQTPLEFAATVDRLSPRVLLLSAEGKNKDILLAAQRSIDADLPTAALTLTPTNPLVELATKSQAVRAFAFPMDWGKDGYLATNSLLATVLLLYRALFGDGDFDQLLAPMLHTEALQQRRQQLFDRVTPVMPLPERGVAIIHSAGAKPFAVDLHSKLEEVALAPVQMTDLRQFAHGRHLQFAHPQPPLALFAGGREDRELVEATQKLLSSHRCLAIELQGSTMQDIAVTGLVDAMFLTEALALAVGVDPGSPEVPAFGRAIHALDPRPLLRHQGANASAVSIAARRKVSYRVGSGDALAHAEAAAEQFLAGLAKAHLKGLICDFDGTLCRTEDRFEGMSTQMIDQLSTLARQGMCIGIATGRGDSLQKLLVSAIEPVLHERIHVGYYSGSVLLRLDEPFVRPRPNPEFASLWAWLQTSGYASLCSRPVDDVARGGQLSLRLDSPVRCRQLRELVRTWLDDRGLRSWRVFCSGHSLDILDATTSKSRVVQALAATWGIDPLSEVLRIGDSGQEDGNDFELLRAGHGLSCDNVSADLRSCWNFGPPGANQAEVALMYLRGLIPTEHGFRLEPSSIPGLHDTMTSA